MPFGAPASPTVGQGYPAENPRWTWDGAKWIAVAGQLVSQDLPLPMVNTDQLLVLRNVAGVQTAFTVAASDLADYAGGAPAASAPAAFTVLQWGLAPITGGLRFTINSLPADGGSAITALQYRLNGGAWTAFSAATTGTYDITGLPATLHTAEVRAVNAVDAGATSDTKSETPAAAGGGGTYEIAATGSSSPGYGDPRTAPVPAGAAAGDRLLIVFSAGGAAAVTGVTDDQSTSYSALSIPSAGADDRVYLSAPLGASIPTTITIDLASAAMVEKADVYVLTGASATVANHGALSTGWSTDPRAHAYTTTGPNEFVFGLVNFTGGGVTGAGSADAAHTWSLNAASGYLHTFATVRAAAGSYGATLAPTGAGSPSEGFWFSLAAS